MKVASLFSGAGGLDLGLQQAGHEIIFQCEIDAGAQQILRQKFPGTHLHPDVCSLDALPEDTELVAAGFPCVDVSRAGKRAGLDGQATVLVKHVFRLLQKAANQNRPVAWVLLENVEALLDRTHSEQPLITYVVKELQAMGYSSWAHRVINTAGFGLPHSRRRVFIVASWHADARDILLSQGAGVCCGACKELFEGQACFKCHYPRQEDMSYAIDMGNAQSPPNVDFLPTIKTGNDRICLMLSSGQYGLLRVEDAERAQGFPAGWTKACYPVAPPGVPFHKLPAITDATVQRREAERWAHLGNAVSVDVARWLGERLREPHRFKYTAGSQDQCFPSISANSDDPAVAARERQYQANWDWDLLGDSALYAFSMRQKADQHQEAGNSKGTLPDSEAAPMDITSEEFQQLITDKDSRGSIVTVDLGFDNRQGGPAWPHAAWYVRGLGRFRVLHMSDAPVLQPLTPLANFITTLGKPPSPDSMQIWLNRMKEQGFEVSPTVKKALQCGAKMQEEVNAVARVDGGLKDSDTVGVIGWAKSADNPLLWWPVEILDPFHMPLTRILPPASTLALSLGEKKLSIPTSAAQKPKSVDWLSQTYCSDLEGAVPQDAASHGLLKTRKVLARFLGERFSSWQLPEQLLPFRKHQAEKEVNASELEHAHKLPRAAQFKIALKEAKELLEVKEGTANAAALASYAASRAASINQHSRCQRCETCLTSTMSNRRCLYLRSAAAAAAGHSGAQLAILGEAARGASIKVWWPLDENWYQGTITAFDELRVQHTICYVDGDVEFLKLWAPNQRVQILNEPKQWASNFADYDGKRKGIKESAESKFACIRSQPNKQKGNESTSAEVIEEELNPYEEARKQTIERNKKRWLELSGEPDESDAGDACEPKGKMPSPVQLPCAKAKQQLAGEEEGKTGQGHPVAAARTPTVNPLITCNLPEPSTPDHDDEDLEVRTKAPKKVPKKVKRGKSNADETAAAKKAKQNSDLQTLAQEIQPKELFP